MIDRPTSFTPDNTDCGNVTDYKGVQLAKPDTRHKDLWEQWRKDQERAAQYQGVHGSYSRTWVEREETKELIQSGSI